MNKPKYIFLDGIRGVAAIFVLTRHTINFWHFKLFHSYLAVDLFFVLSGFVIAYAYEGRLMSGALSFTKFAKIRLIRLYPVYSLSVFICAALWFGGPKFYRSVVDARQIGLATLSSLLFLPYHVPGDDGLFPANGAYWSLFFELIGNLIYAGSRGWLTDRRLVIAVATSGFAVAFLALRYGNLDMGYGWYISHFAAGFSRAMFGLLLGILLYRRRSILLRYVQGISPWFSIIVVCGILAIPSFPAYDALIDIVAVTVIFPLCVCAASQSIPSRLTTPLIALGSASYPLYVLHVPLVQMLSSELYTVIDEFAPMSGILLVPSLILMCLLVERMYDLPLRSWLARIVLGVVPV